MSSAFSLHERAMMAVKLQECSRSLGPAGRSLGYLVRVVCGFVCFIRRIAYNVVRPGVPHGPRSHLNSKSIPA